MRITQTEVSWRSLNEGDVFVLECKDTVWCWIGTDCSRLEKIKVCTCGLWVLYFGGMFQNVQ